MQLEFAAHIRNPEVNEVPSGLEARRMKIYAELFYNNIEGFLASTFPVCKRILTAAGWSGVAWHEVVRSFVHRHGSSSPYFLEISQEFLEFIGEGEHEPLPDWFLELAHYEWVEMALAVAEEELPERSAGEDDQLPSAVRVSPLAWPLAYRYPVHEIGPEHLPDRPGDTPTCLIVYRRRDLAVRFLVSNPLTLALLEEIDRESNLQAAMNALAEKLEMPVRDVHIQAEQTLARLLDCDIVLPVTT